MNTREIVQKSIHIITEYYKNNLMPYFDMIDDDILWYGPANGQFLQGKRAIIDAWEKEDNRLTFTMGNIVARSVSVGSACEVILSYPVTTHYPSGADITVNQHLHYSWVERKRTLADGTVARLPRIIVIHITNPYRQSEKDAIYPAHFDELQRNEISVPVGEKRFTFKGKGASVYCLYPQSIGWIESSGKGKQSTAHLLDGEKIDLLSAVTAIEAETAPFFVRVHESYLVNPRFVKKIERFKITLNDGTVLPVPEKKYTRIRDRIGAQARRERA